jgi:hypothetical protein
MTSGKPADYTNWKAGEPNNYNKTEHFGQITNMNYHRYWNDCPNFGGVSICTLPFHGLCQFVL